MGLDATVYCNCYETGCLIVAPPGSVQLSVASDGSLDFGDQDLDTLLALDEWLLNSACAHRNGTLLHHRIGNIARVALLRTELAREAEKFPVLLKRVLYDGTHGGDHLSLDDVARVRIELLSLDTFVCSDSEKKEYIELFTQQMRELTEASLSVGKPIAF